MQDHVKQARTTQVETTEVLADLLQAPNIAATARNNIDSINEEFFMVSSTYLDMVCHVPVACHTCKWEQYSWKALLLHKQAKKEGNTEVCRKLEEVLRVAMEEKQKTLRPEIQLLNNLMAATTVPERERVCLHAKLSLHNSAIVFCCIEILSRRQAWCQSGIHWRTHCTTIIAFTVWVAGAQSRHSKAGANHEQWLFLWPTGQNDIR